MASTTELRQRNPGYAERNREFARARSRALNELARRHEEEYRALYQHHLGLIRGYNLLASYAEDYVLIGGANMSAEEAADRLGCDPGQIPMIVNAVRRLAIS